MFVHPSGAEKPLRETIDELRKYHGDKQGKKFRVWADQVLATDTTPGTWIVKLDKWEQSGKAPKSHASSIDSKPMLNTVFLLAGDERRGCTTTVKFTAKV